MNQDSINTGVSFNTNQVLNNNGPNTIQYLKNRAGKQATFRVTGCSFNGNTNTDGNGTILSIVMNQQSESIDVTDITVAIESSFFINNTANSIIKISYVNSKNGMSVTGNTFINNAYDISMILEGSIYKNMQIKNNNFNDIGNEFVRVNAPYVPNVQVCSYHGDNKIPEKFQKYSIKIQNIIFF